MKTRIAVLAAGHGTRMKSEVPKALRLLAGKPIIQHLLDAISQSGVDPRPIVVVGPNNQDIIKKTLGDEYEYVLQETPRGTADAVKYTELVLKNADSLIVLYADHPFVHAETIQNLHTAHKENDCPLTMATSTVPDFNEWRAPLYDFGRIVRNGNGGIHEIVEKKDAEPEQLSIKEVNPSYFCFDTNWLWENIKKLGNDNAQHEYYLTDLVRIAIDGGSCLTSIDINPLESIGVNTPSHFELAEELVTVTAKT